jgi:hypothetical protein
MNCFLVRLSLIALAAVAVGVSLAGAAKTGPRDANPTPAVKSGSGQALLPDGCTGCGRPRPT